jgi:prophage DNA circulation protein
MDGLNALITEFDKPTPGVLTHPIYGDLACVPEEVTFTHQNDQRKAVALHVTFIEHNFTVGDFKDDPASASNLKNALSKALMVFAAIDTAINTVNASILMVKGVKNILNQYLNIFKQTQAKTLTQMNIAFNSAGGSTDIPALLPVNVGGTGVATTTSGAAVTVASAPGAAKQASLGSTSSFATTGVGDAGNAPITGITSTVVSSNFPTTYSISDAFNGVPAAQLQNLSQQTLTAIFATQMIKQVSVIFTQLGSIIQLIEDNGAYLEQYDTVLSLRQTAILIQSVLETGIASSSATLIMYTVPWVMSLREVAWANGIPPDRVQDLDILNPTLLSINYIAAGTVLQVPSS